MCGMRLSRRNVGKNSCGNCRGRFHQRPSATRRLNAIEGESATGGNRPGAGAAPVPKPKPPHTKRGILTSQEVPAHRRSLTRWRGTRKIQTTTKRGGGDVRAEWLAVRAAIGLANPGSFRGQSVPDLAATRIGKKDAKSILLSAA